MHPFTPEHPKSHHPSGKAFFDWDRGPRAAEKTAKNEDLPKSFPKSTDVKDNADILEFQLRYVA